MTMLTLKSRSQWRSLLDAKALNSPDASADAIIFLETGKDPVHISCALFTDQVEAYASAFRSLGIKPRDLVIIAHTQNLESIYAFWGALMIGAIPSMFPTLTEKLDPQKYMADIALLIKHAGARAVLTTSGFAPELRQVVSCQVIDTNVINLHVKSLDRRYKPEFRDIAFLQHSSGTTGLQKGVALSHEAVLNQLASYSDALQLSHEDVIVSWLPLYHDMGLIAGFLLPLVQGIPLVLMSPFDWVRHPAMLFKAIDTYKGTLCWLPNFAYNHCARRIRQRDLEGLDVSGMRAFINCSEPVQAVSHERFVARFNNIGVRREHLAVSYAMAENTFAVTQTFIGQPAKVERVDQACLIEKKQAVPVTTSTEEAIELVSCGPVIDGAQIRVVDETNDILSDRQVGEISIRSNSMLTGYYKRPDLNNAISNGWYNTGDMGYVADGELYIIGRKKDLIIAGGKNIYPQDIEAIVNTIKGVHPGRNVVFGVPDEREGTELIVVVAETDITDDDMRQTIARDIRRVIAEQSTVTASYVTLVDRKWLLKTSSGKIARAANRDKWLAER